MPSVVIHRYVKVGGDGVGRAKAHIRYIQHRRGDDREHQEERAVGGKRARREFFDARREAVDRRELNKLIEREPVGGVAIHKLTLSPGVQGVDLKEYTREVLDELGKMKGLDLNWAAVAHKNTNHDHVHVVVLGTDDNGRQVRLDKSDHDLLRYKSDLYLDREHAQDRQLAREAKEAERVEREVGSDKTQQRLASLLGKGQRFEERETWSRERALLEMPESEKIAVRGRTYTRYDTKDDLKALDKHLKGNFKERIDRRQYAMLQRWIDAKERHGDDCHERWDRQRWQRGQRSQQRQAKGARHERGCELYRKLPKKQFLIEQQGRTSEYHATYMNLMAKQRLMQARERTNDIQIKRQIDKELELLKQLRQEQLKDIPVIDLDSLYGKGKDRKLEWKRQEPDRPLRLEEIKFDDLLSLAEEAQKKEAEAKTERKSKKSRGEVDKEREPSSESSSESGGDVQRERDDPEKRESEPEKTQENDKQKPDDPQKSRDKKEWDLLKGDLEQVAKELKDVKEMADERLKRTEEDDDRQQER